MGYRETITLTCDMDECLDQPQGAYIAEYLGIIVYGGKPLIKLLCGFHAKARHGKIIWNSDATLFPLSGDTPERPQD